MILIEITITGPVAAGKTYLLDKLLDVIKQEQQAMPSRRIIVHTDERCPHD